METTEEQIDKFARVIAEGLHHTYAIQRITDEGLVAGASAMPETWSKAVEALADFRDMLDTVRGLVVQQHERALAAAASSTGKPQ
jgi:hypothetical protein